MASKDVDKIVATIVDLIQPLQIILFGSSARGESHSFSDVDLLVVMPRGSNRRKTAQYLYQELVGFRTPVDLVVATADDLTLYADTPGLVYQEALAEGVTLYAA